MKSAYAPALLAATVALVAGGCSSASAPIEATSHAVPASTISTAPDADGVLPRFENEIWPVVNAYNGHPQQNAKDERAFIAVLVPDLPFEAHRNVTLAARAMGNVGPPDQLENKPARDENGIRLVETALTALSVQSSTIQTCYTYTTAMWDPTKPPPMFSEATFELRKTDNWYVYSITNDHVVQGCPDSSKV